MAGASVPETRPEAAAPALTPTDLQADTIVGQWFWRHVRQGEPWECWPWRGRRTKAGYGIVSEFDGMAHCIAYEFVYGAMPPGYLGCHECDNPPCCNPYHVYAGTDKDNARDRQLGGCFYRFAPYHCMGSGRATASCLCCRRRLCASCLQRHVDGSPPTGRFEVVMNEKRVTRSRREHGQRPAVASVWLV